MKKDLVRKFSMKLSLRRVYPALLLSALPFLSCLAEPAKTSYTVAAKVPAANPFWSNVFTVINYAAGMAVVAAIVFGVIWFVKNRNLLEDSDNDITGQVVEATAAAEGGAESKV